MAKSMVTEKVRISPYLHREITNLVEDGDFASISDFINVAVSSFLSKNFGIDDRPSFEIPLMLLYGALIDKGLITKEDMNNVVKKLKNGEWDDSIFQDLFSGILSDLIEYDIYDMLDMGKEMENKKSYDEAERIYKDAIKEFPEDFEPNFNLGCLYLRTGKKEEGLQQLEIALQKARDMEEEDIIEMISSEIKKIK